MYPTWRRRGFSGPTPRARIGAEKSGDQLTFRLEAPITLRPKEPLSPRSLIAADHFELWWRVGKRFVHLGVGLDGRGTPITVWLDGDEGPKPEVSSTDAGLKIHMPNDFLTRSCSEIDIAFSIADETGQALMVSTSEDRKRLHSQVCLAADRGLPLDDSHGWVRLDPARARACRVPTSEPARDALRVELPASNTGPDLREGCSDAGNTPEKSAQACPEGMAWIPGGSSPNSQRKKVAAFCLDITEVTVAQYWAHAADGGASWCNENKLERQNHPVCVTWDEAMAFCGANGNRLPTEQEWDWAARGGANNWRYPWGNDPPGTQGCWNRGTTRTCPVGSFPRDTNFWGVKDLAGNSSEWTSSLYSSQLSVLSMDGQRVARGASHSSDWNSTQFGTERHGTRPSHASHGFRCARSP